MHTYTKIIPTCTIHIHRIPAVVCFVFLLHISRTEVIIILHTRIQLLFHLCMYWVCVSKTINKWCVVYSMLFLLSTPPHDLNLHRTYIGYILITLINQLVSCICASKSNEQSKTTHHITSHHAPQPKHVIYIQPQNMIFLAASISNISTASSVPKDTKAPAYHNYLCYWTTATPSDTTNTWIMKHWSLLINV